MSRLFRDVDGGSLCPRGSVVCIGAFDGLHLGHRALVRHAVARAQALGLPAVALSFEPLPREFFARDTPPPRLTLPRDRIEALLGLGIDRLGLLRFNAALAAMPADEFVRRVLAGRLGAREVWIGPEFRFGNRRGGDLALLQDMGEELGFAAGEIAPVHVHGERVSSTRIREALRAGDFGHAAALLGRPYAIGGRVVRGRQLGRTLGYPTANLRFPKTPALSGIYATWVHGAGPQPLPSVSSFGTRPTVDGVEPLLEAHLFDFAGDLYGRHLQVEFVAKLRDEEKFADLESLTVQMHRDAAQARSILADAAPPALLDAQAGADFDSAISSEKSAQPCADFDNASPSQNPAHPCADFGNASPSQNPAHPCADFGNASPSQNPAHPCADFGNASPSQNPAHPCADSSNNLTAARR